ncbi:MAG: hypothetical protein Q9166_000879 [cf. Caloplaca sp. 2 TL-2023]
MDDPDYNFTLGTDDAGPSSASTAELSSFYYPQFDGNNDENSPPDTTITSSPTARFSSHQASRKRNRGSQDASLSTETLAKSRKTTPSPALTGNTTPASFGDFDFSADPYLMELLGGNPKEHLAEMQQEQREQEERLWRKQKQEREDEELARKWQEEYDYQPPAPSESFQTRPAMPNLALAPLSQSFLNSSGRVRKGGVSKLDPRDSRLPSSQSAYELPFSPQSHGLFKAPNRETAKDNQPSLPAWQDQNSQQVQNHIYSPPPSRASDDLIKLSSDDDITILGSGQAHVTNDSQASNKADQDMTSFGSQWTGHAGTGTSNDISIGTDSHNPRNAFDDYGSLSLGGLGGTNVYDAPSGITFGSPSNLQGWSNRLGGFGQSVTDMAKGAFASAQNLFGQNSSSYPSGVGSYLQPVTFSSSPTATGFGSTKKEETFMSDEELRFGGALPGNERMNAQWRQKQQEDVSDEEWLRERRNRYNERMDYLINDPTRSAAEIQDLIDNIRPDEDLPPENREGTPEAMVYPLMEHQKLGLAWMKSMEEGSNKGGILADGMGLGKTIQAIALMASRRSTDPNRKTTLIIAPVALMKQWEREIRMKLKLQREHRLTTYILHGSGRQTYWEDLKTYDVVLTTFGTLSTELKRKETIDRAKATNPNWVPITRADRLPLLGEECKWYRVIIDEAQCIKNRLTKAAIGACALQAQTRFAMSGTPMQNNVTELFSLIRFLRIKPYNDFSRFSTDFSRPLKSTNDQGKVRAMRKLQALLKAILLRRDKKSTIDGKPILNLPERTTESQHAAFSEDEQTFYNALESRTQLQFNKYLRAGTVGRNYSNVLVLLLRLRQACCHPHLIKDFGVPSSAAEAISEDLEKMARELAPDVVARIIEQGDSNDQNGLECPVCMDATENATIFVPCGHNTCSECFARISDPSQAIANGDDGGTNLRCPQCRGKIVVSKVTDHSTFKKVHMHDDSAAEEVAAELENALNTETESDDESTDDEGSDLGGFVVNDDEESFDGGDYRKGNTPFERCSKVKKSKEKSAKGKGKAKAEPQVQKKNLAQLKKESLRNAKAKKKYLARVRKTWESSAKIDRTMEILRAVNARKEGEKTIIFSQFTSLLDLLEVPIYDEGWKYQRYDGSMSANARNDAVMEFSDKPECKLMLVSLRAGNAGLNLVAASQVIIMDPFWNPYVEEQAIDRAHRIGQQKPVQVHRMLIPETVEDRILALQEKKRLMIESALDENASKQVSRLGTRELAYLFGVQS